MLTSYDKKRRVQWAKQHQNDDFKRKVEKENPKILMNLNFLVEEFQNTEINVVKNCVMSMKKRFLSLISSRGERIKY